MGLGFKKSFPFIGSDRSNSSLASPDEWLISAILGGLKTSAGIDVTPVKALGVSTVLACVNIISRAIATMPLVVYEKDRSGARSAPPGTSSTTFLHLSPNPNMTSSEFLMAMQGNLTLRNNAYALIKRSQAGYTQLIPIDPIDMKVSKDDKGKLVYEIAREEVPSKSILHLRGLSSNGLAGLDTVAYSREAIALSIALQDDLGRFFPQRRARRQHVADRPDAQARDGAEDQGVASTPSTRGRATSTRRRY